MQEWEGVRHAVEVALAGDRGDGRAPLEACWADVDDTDHALRCVVAHYLADVQDDLVDEIRWDESALRHFASVGDDDLAAIGIPSAAALAPSLHLNLGDGYLRRGDLPAARRELQAGLACAGALGEDGYAAMIGRGLAGLADRLRDRDG